MFHVKDKESMISFTKEARFCLAGDYLVHRSKKTSKNIWITNIKKGDDGKVAQVWNDDGNNDEDNSKDLVQQMGLSKLTKSLT